MQTLKVTREAVPTTLTRAIARAKDEKPLVSKTAEAGMYQVLSKSGKIWYYVYCNTATNEITCTCPARKPCKHCVAAYSYHRFLTEQTPREPASTASTQEHDKPVPSASASYAHTSDFTARDPEHTANADFIAIEPADQPEEHASIAESARQVACDRCAAIFEPSQWEIDSVELEGGYYFCAACTQWQIEQARTNGVYFSFSDSDSDATEEEGGPSYGTF